MRYRALRRFYYMDDIGEEHLSEEGELLVENTPQGRIDELLNDGLIERVADEASDNGGDE